MWAGRQQEYSCKSPSLCRQRTSWMKDFLMKCNQPDIVNFALKDLVGIAFTWQTAG